MFYNEMWTVKTKIVPPKNFILGQKFSAIVLKIFVRLAKSCLPDFSSALHVATLLHSSTLILMF